MPIIVAICPYCRAGGVRAKDSAVGASATCPRCKSSFTVMPEEILPAGATASKPKASPLTETQQTAAIPDVTEPSPVLPPEAKPRPAPESQTELSPTVVADGAMVFALFALILVGPAVLASQLLFGRFIAIVLALVGFGGGLLCLGEVGKARLAGALAAILHFGIIAILLFLPSWLNLDPWRGSTPMAEPSVPEAVENVSGARTPIAANDWLEANRYSWQFGEVRVSVAAALDAVELHGPNGAKQIVRGPYLHLVLRIANAGVEREIPLSGWMTAGTDGIFVADANGQPLAPVTFKAGWSPARNSQSSARVMPGNAADVRLVFAAPPAKTEFVRVRVSGSAFGMKDELQFRAGLIQMHPQGGRP